MIRSSFVHRAALVVASSAWLLAASAEAQVTITAEVSSEPVSSPDVPAAYVPVADAAAPPMAAPAEPLPPRAPTRIVGFGTSFGGGVAVAGAYSASISAGSGLVAGPAILLPTLEGLIFIDDHFSIDFSIPLWNTIVISSFSNGLFLWGTNVLLDFSIGDDWVRFIVGPEIGFSYASYLGYSATQVTVGAMVGLELLSWGRSFGFRVMTRPNIGVAIGSGGASEVVGLGGSALIEIGLISYLPEG